MIKKALLNLKNSLAYKNINLIETNYALMPNQISYEIIDGIILLLKFTENNYDLICELLSENNYKIYAIGGTTYSSYMWLKFSITT